MNKTYRSVLLWGIAALICLFALARPSYAANISEIPGFKLGPGDYYDEAGNICALGGKVLVKADGEIVDEDLAAEARNLSLAASIAAGISSEPVMAAASEAVKEEEKAPAIEKTAEEKPAEEKPAVPSYTVSSEGDKTVYTYEGKKYQAVSSYGVHKLSGYCPTPKYGARTYSGKDARPHHTVSVASDLPIGTVVILKASSGPYASDYDGVYVVEDRGGYYIEQEGWIDIFFDTAWEADHVTAAGWNYAEVWIAKEVE